MLVTTYLTKVSVLQGNPALAPARLSMLVWASHSAGMSQARPGAESKFQSSWGSGFKDTGALCSQLGYISTEAVRALSVTSGTHIPSPPWMYSRPSPTCGGRGWRLHVSRGRHEKRNGAQHCSKASHGLSFCWHKRVLRRETGSWKRVHSAQIQPGSPERKRRCFRLQAISQWESVLSLSAPVQSRTGGTAEESWLWSHSLELQLLLLGVTWVWASVSTSVKWKQYYLLSNNL